MDRLLQCCQWASGTHHHQYYTCIFLRFLGRTQASAQHAAWFHTCQFHWKQSGEVVQSWLPHYIWGGRGRLTAIWMSIQACANRGDDDPHFRFFTNEDKMGNTKRLHPVARKFAAKIFRKFSRAVETDGRQRCPSHISPSNSECGRRRLDSVGKYLTDTSSVPQGSLGSWKFRVM
jgi:hypothetical protein